MHWKQDQNGLYKGRFYLRYKLPCNLWPQVVTQEEVAILLPSLLQRQSNQTNHKSEIINQHTLLNLFNIDAI